MPKGKGRKRNKGKSMQQAAPVPQLPMDQWPKEVLKSIFDHCPSSTHPISKPLLPFTQANLYHSVTLPGWDRRAKFSAALRMNPTLADLVFHLSIGTGTTDDPGEEIPSSELEQLFGALANVAELSVRGPTSTRVVEAVLAETVMQSGLGRLRILSIAGPFSGWPSPFEWARYRHLRQCELLEHLGIDAWRYGADQAFPSTYGLEAAERIGVVSLSLEGPLSSPDAVDFVSHFTDLSSLDLRDSTPRSNLTPLLENVTTPEEVVSLDVRTCNTRDEVLPIDGALARFSSLADLTLHDSTFTDAVFETLVHLPLKPVCFTGTDVSGAELCALVAESDTLQSLCIDFLDLEAEEGESLYDWKLPRWSARFDAEGARELLEAADDASVELGEDLLNALAVEDAFSDLLEASGEGSMVESQPISSTVTSAAPTDALSRLPPELLLDILDLSEATKPISRLLLPYTQRNLYRHVIIRDAEQLARFSATCVTRPHLGGLVKTLNVDFDNESKGPSKASVKKDGEPSDEQLVQMCSTLVAVTVLGTDFRRLCTLLLSRTATSRFFLSLITLGLEDPVPQSPWCFTHYRHLSAYPELYRLHLTSTVDDAASSSWADGEPFLSNWAIDHLYLEGALSNPAAAALLAHFPGLSRLCLQEVEQQHDVSPILLKSPNTLRILAIMAGHPDPHPSLPLDDALGRFTKLQRLTLVNGTFTNDLFTTYLRDPLPLSTLTIFPRDGHGVELSAAALKDLVMPGPGRLAALETLEVFLFEAERGTSIREPGPYVGLDGYDVYPDWRPALWTDAFSFEDAKRLVRLAKEAGVTVGGSLLQAIEIEEEYWDEVMLVEEELEMCYSDYGYDSEEYDSEYDWLG